MEKYGLKKAEQREMLPEKDLIVIPHEGKPLGVAVFGPDIYKNNLEEMGKRYFHSKEFPSIRFRPATTSESISAVSHDFGEEKEFDAKRDIIDPRWLQTGYIVRTQDGVFTNILNTDEKYLKNLLNNAQKVNGIYLINNETAFAPYESFKAGVQYAEDFVEGGLARALEHTEGKVAENLKKISSLYEKGVNVYNFDQTKKPVLRVLALDDNLDDDRLCVDGNDWNGDDEGCAFGVSVAD